jgi:hypothetical protein
MSNVTPIKPGQKPAPRVCRYGFTAEEAVAHFEALRGDDSCIEHEVHLLKRLDERDIAYEQVLRVLRNGRLVEGPYLRESLCWRMRYRDFDAGDDLSVVAELEQRKMGEFLIVVTVIHHGETEV